MLVEFERFKTVGGLNGCVELLSSCWCGKKMSKKPIPQPSPLVRGRLTVVRLLRFAVDDISDESWVVVAIGSVCVCVDEVWSLF
ncbi:hypothetical protein HanRHA438_Chr10g0446571 [Helianthus annuus]|nr:hypothetical protein HanRHA438_Chr10g0446571 [Helianthus annuus]